MPRLENWSVISTSNNPYRAPELLQRQLGGNIHNDEKNRFANGTYIVTSDIKELDLKNMIAKTRNTIYELGRMSLSYQEWLKEKGLKLEDFIK